MGRPKTHLIMTFNYLSMVPDIMRRRWQKGKGSVQYGGGGSSGEINQWKEGRNLLLNTQSSDVLIIQNHTPLELGTFCNSGCFKF